MAGAAGGMHSVLGRGDRVSSMVVYREVDVSIGANLSHKTIQELIHISKVKMATDGDRLAALIDRLRQHEMDVERIKNPDRFYSSMRDSLIPSAANYADGQVAKTDPDSKRQWDRVFLRRMTELAADSGLVSKEMLTL